MKKILFFFLTALFVSCSADEGLQDMSVEDTTLAEELKNIANGYELMIKGYTIEEIRKEKDETSRTKGEETIAEPWMIKAIQDSLSKTIFSYGSKTRADAQPFAGGVSKVGVFKYETCGNNREFVYFMDCEDGGDTKSSGNIGSSEVDGNGNVRFRFCLVPFAGYGGGVLLLCDFSFSSSISDVRIVERYHDDQDGNNKNKIEDNGGLSYTGATQFSANTKFSWIYHPDFGNKLPFRYGVLGDSPTGPVPGNSIYTDDEDTRNGNVAYLFSGPGIENRRELAKDEYFRGIQAGRNTIYSIKIR